MPFKRRSLAQSIITITSPIKESVPCAVAQCTAAHATRNRQGSILVTRISRFLASAHGQPVDRYPVWIMRQAGRYIPRYRELRKSHTFLDLCRNPDLATEVTMLPASIIDPDALVFFSDILTVLPSINIPISFQTGGPQILEPLVPGQQDLSKHENYDRDGTSFVFQGLKQTKEADKDNRALLGFAGAPLTLAFYAIEGMGSKEFSHARAALYEHPKWMKRLLTILTDMTISYLKDQVTAGADAIQLFDTWAGMLSEDMYNEWVLPTHKKIFAALTPLIPTILYTRGTSHVLHLLGESGANVISLDWRIPIDHADNILPKSCSIQGNIDPTLLLSSEMIVREQTIKSLSILPNKNSHRGRIMNLGHGILPQTPIKSAQIFTKSVADYKLGN